MIENNKVRFAQKKHNNIGPESYKNYNLTSNISNIIVHERSMIPGEGSRTHFPTTYSQPELFIPGQKKVDHLESSGDIRGQCRRIIKPKQPVLSPEGKGDRTHFLKEDARRSDEYVTPGCDWMRRCIIRTSTGASISTKRDGVQYQIEGIMNQKTRVDSHESRRNNINEASGGDKYYKDADREPGFYAKGGIISGSTIQLRKSAKPSFRVKEDDPNNPHKKKENKKAIMTYKEKEIQNELDYEKGQVASLTNAFEKQGQTIPSWENKTGFRLIEPDYENY